MAAEALEPDDENALGPNHLDPDAVRKPQSIGACRCPGTPHAGSDDFVTIVRQFSYGDITAIRRAHRMLGPEAATAVSILRGVKAWTLVLPDGKPRPIDEAQVALLDEPTVDVIDELVGAAFHPPDPDLVPNGSGAPSPSGSQESATPIQTSPEPPPSTTS